MALKVQFSLSMVSLTIWLGISYTSLMGWKRRVLANEPPIKKTGPKKTEPLDLIALEKEIGYLEHGRKRSRGATALITKYRPSVSRRHMARLIKEARQHANNKLQNRITWHYPGIAWAIDGCEIKSAAPDTRVYVQNLQDMYSTYKFIPLITRDEPDGEEVTIYLEAAFKKSGVPLFLKRDNAGNYNSRAVNDLMGKWMVIPLNSPSYYAPYNGGIEHTQGELKSCFKNKKNETAGDLALQVEMAIHDLNHKSRRLLKGRNACQAYFNTKHPVYGRRRRRQIFDWIRDLAIDISVKAGMDKISASAWRFACRKWMEENGVITVKRQRKVLPDFSLNFCQN